MNQRKFRWTKKRKIELCKCYELSVKNGDHNHNTLLKIWKERNKTFDTAITAFELSELRKKFEMYNSFSDIIKKMMKELIKNVTLLVVINQIK